MTKIKNEEKVNFVLDFFIKKAYTVPVMNHYGKKQDGVDNVALAILIEKIYCNNVNKNNVTRKVVKDNNTYQREWELVTATLGSFEVTFGVEYNAGKKDDVHVGMLIKHLSTDRLLYRHHFWKYSKESLDVKYWEMVSEIFKRWNNCCLKRVSDELWDVIKSI